MMRWLWLELVMRELQLRLCCIDIRLSAGISPAYFYTSVYKSMDAILCSGNLSYKFPSTAKELEEATQGFELLSNQAAIKGCVVIKSCLLPKYYPR